MKKVFAVLTILGVILFGMTSTVFAQDYYESEEATHEAPARVQEPVAPVQAVEQMVEQGEKEVIGLHKTMKIKFIEGSAGFMSLLALLLIFGLALCIERIIYLSLASVNTKKLLKKITEALDNNDVEEAKEVCRNTRGPVASILYQGLTRIDEGPEVVEKTVISYGGVQTGLMERGLPWISLFIGITPMIGFMGTVYGMIIAFDRIQQVGDLSATVIAGGIKLALITTVAALIVAILLQLFYNYIITKIDNLVGDMEDASISLLDIIIKYNLKSSK